MWKKSLRARLTLYIVLPVMVALLAIGAVGFKSAYDEAREIYDTELSHIAALMLSLLQAEDMEEAKHIRPQETDEMAEADIVDLGGDFENTGDGHDRELAFRIWKNKKLLFYSKKAANFGAERTMAGFSNQEIDGKQWRLYVLPDAIEGYTLEVAQRLKIRNALITKVLETIFSPLVLLLPVIFLLTWIGLRTGLKPLLSVSEAVKRRSALDLTPLPVSGTLSEIKPLVNSINGLLANLDYAIRKEQRFTDFAAHELRTPIAIFKTQAQTALKATNETERQTILEAQVQAADRATDMVDQLLTLARLEHTDIPIEALSLGDIVKELVDERMPLAGQKHLVLRFDRQSGASIHGNRQLLTIITSNLIDNAIKYTPVGGEIVVTLLASGDLFTLSVCDTGPGIPESSLPFVTERFFRVSRHQQPGAGLGLTIVKRATEIIGASLILRNRSDRSGLESIIQLPAS